MKEVLVIVEYDYSDGDKMVIGAASDRDNALLIIRDYYGKDSVESRFMDYREDGLDFSVNIEVSGEYGGTYRVTAMDFEINRI